MSQVFKATFLLAFVYPIIANKSQGASASLKKNEIHLLFN
jgi:hypothetical protein